MTAKASDTDTDTAAPATGASGVETSRWAWVRRHWPLWVALALGAFVRLWLIDRSSFLGDQIGLFGLARAGLLQHALPVASIPFSIGPLSPPFTTYLLVPFAALSSDPFPAVLFIALWNVAGIVFSYVFALRYFGWRVAGVTALLLATSGVAVNYSRLVWQVGFLMPLLALWGLSLFAGCVRGRPHWLVLNVAMLTMALLLHPVAGALWLVTLVGILLAPRKPRLWEYAAAAMVVVLLALPTALWEIASHGMDIPTILSYAHQPSTISLSFLYPMFGALGAPSATDFGPNSLYAAFGDWYPFINILAVLLFATGYLALTWSIFLPARALWRQETSPRWQDALRRWSIAVWRGLHQNAGWRAETLLWLWVTLPCVFMIKHSSPPHTHYFMVLVPALFIVSGFGFQFVWRQATQRRAAGASASGTGGGPARGLKAWLPALTVAGLVVLVGAQAVQSALYPAALISKGFDALTFYGYPLGDLQTASAQLSALQRTQGASAIYISEYQTLRFQGQLQFALVGEHPDRSGLNDDCLILPPADAAPVLVVSSAATSPTGALLPQLSNARRVADLNIPGGAPLGVYRVSGATPTLPGDTAVTPVVFRDASGAGLRLDAAAAVAPTLLRLRWTVLASTPAGQPPSIYQTEVRVPTSDGGSSGRLSMVECRPARWQAGETVFTWMNVAHTAQPGQSASDVPPPPSSVNVRVNQGAGGLITRSLGPLRVIAWEEVDTFGMLPAAQVGGQPVATEPGSFTTKGEYTLPVSLTP